VLVIDQAETLVGIFTDSDLARLFERRREEMLDRAIRWVMTSNPKHIAVGASVGEAVDLMKAHKISELPVVDRGGWPVGLVDITDLIGLLPDESEE
jgi:arabinose-5-phosphate isomerase